MEQIRRQETQIESLFVAWQREWSDRRDQISQHLQTIESQLDKLQGNEQPPPQLSVVGMGEED